MEKEVELRRWRYTGSDPNTQFIPGVPARDITEDDLREYGVSPKLLDGSALYTLQVKEPKAGERWHAPPEPETKTALTERREEKK